MPRASSWSRGARVYVSRLAERHLRRVRPVPPRPGAPAAGRPLVRAGRRARRAVRDRPPRPLPARPRRRRARRCSCTAPAAAWASPPSSSRWPPASASSARPAAKPAATWSPRRARYARVRPPRPAASGGGRRGHRRSRLRPHRRAAGQRQPRRRLHRSRACAAAWWSSAAAAPWSVNPRDLMNVEGAVLGMLSCHASRRKSPRPTRPSPPACATGRCGPVVGREFPLAEAARAHHHLMERPSLGKLVLVP